MQNPSPLPPAPAEPRKEIRIKKGDTVRSFRDEQPLMPGAPTLNPVEKVANESPHVMGPDSGSVRAPFRTNLTVSREVEDLMMHMADQWEKNLKDVSGWNGTADEGNFVYTGVGSDPLRLNFADRPHFEKRALFRAISENNWRWRRWFYGKDSVFVDQNLSAPVCRRISTAMAAKGIGYFFGARPYFACYPVSSNPEVTNLAKSLQKISELKMDRSGSSLALRDSVATAFDLGEGILKTSHERRLTLSKKQDTVMVDEAGKFVFGKDGDYITPKDQFIMGQVPAMNEDGTPVLDAQWQPVMLEAQVLKRDGQTIVKSPAEGWRFVPGLIARRTVHYRGPRIKEIYYRNFLCPLDAEDVQTADCVIHTYEATPIELCSYFTDSVSSKQLIQSVQMLREASNAPLVSSYDPSAPSSSQQSQIKLQVQEFWMRIDADQDGIAEDICFVRAGQQGQFYPLFYDYTENVTATKRRPFHIVRAKARKGRWTGIGAIEVFLEHQMIVDLMLNRWSFSTSNSGYITVFKPEAFEETSGDDPDLKLNDGKSYRVKPAYKLDDVVKRFYLENTVGVKFKELMELFLQLAVNESGVQTANDGQVAGLQSTELATGLRQMEAAGNELFGVYVSTLEPGLTSAIDAFVATLYGNVEGEEVARYDEGGIPQELKIEERDVQGLQFEVSVCLARFKSETLVNALASLLGAAPIVTYYTAIVDPTAKEGFRNALIQLLTAMNVENPEKIVLLPVMDPMVMQNALAVLAQTPPEVQQALAPLVQMAGAGAGAGAQPQPSPQAAGPAAKAA